MKEELEIFSKEFLKIPEKDIDRFKALVNKLINVNYLTAYKEEDKSNYYFICNYMDCFKNYFLLGGRELLHYSNQRTLVLQSEFTSKMSLNKIASITLLILRLLYTQKMQDISLNNQINVLVVDIQEKYEQLAISSSERLKVGEMAESLRVLKKYNIIDYKGTDFQNDNFVITLYPTIQYAVGIEDIKTLIDKINSYIGKEEENEEAYEN